MIPPLLKLEFVQGPRDGDSLEYKPGSTIRIGRIVRGNEIAIKDKGISTKHLRIDSDSEKWIIHDLGSSNGTILNSETLDPDTPVNLRHGDVIKLGEYTSIVVNFVSDVDVQAQEHKLPPRPRRNNRRLPVPDPDPDPIEPVQEKPTKRTSRASRSKNLELEIEKEVKIPRVGRPRKNEKKVAITNVVQEEEEEEEEAPEEKKGNSRVRRGTNTESVENLGLNSIKLEIEDTPKGVEISAMKRATRSKQIENACLGMKNVKIEDSAIEDKDEKRISRATRSKKKEVGGDSFLELEMVLNQARKSRAKKKQIEQKPSKSVVEVEVRNDDVEDQRGCTERSDDKCDKEDERVEIELRESTLGEEDINCSVREDGETENLQDTIDEGRERKSEEERDDGCEEEKVEQESSNKNVEKVEVDLKTMTLREFSKVLAAQLRKQMVEETEKLIEPMRSKSLRVHKYIAEQKESKGKGR